MVSLLPTKFHEILFSSFRGVALTSCFSCKFRIYIYVWKLSQTVLELEFRAVKFCSSLDRIRTHTIDTLQHHSLSLTSSALDHSTTSTPYIYIYVKYIYIKEIIKKRTKRIFHNILVLTFSLLLQIFRYNVYNVLLECYFKLCCRWIDDLPHVRLIIYK
jgi:hypothetical protein